MGSQRKGPKNQRPSIVLRRRPAEDYGLEPKGRRCSFNELQPTVGAWGLQKNDAASMGCNGEGQEATQNGDAPSTGSVDPEDKEQQSTFNQAQPKVDGFNNWLPPKGTEANE